jgi:hypothetical protein
MRRVIPDAELAMDQCGDAAQGPEICRVAGPDGALQQEPYQPPLLGF